MYIDCGSAMSVLETGTHLIYKVSEFKSELYLVTSYLEAHHIQLSFVFAIHLCIDLYCSEWKDWTSLYPHASLHKGQTNQRYI